MNADTIIVGAGLSGLACALTLQKAGHKTLVLESGGTVGGRVKTRKTADGFILDEGFQVLLNSYPELSKFVDLSQLNLKKFNSGALVYNGKKMDLLANPIAHPETLVSSLFKDTLTTQDKALVLKLIATSQFNRDDSQLGEVPTAQFLKQFGFSEDFIELFWRPFLTGIYLDPTPEMGHQYFKFLIRCFSTGKVSVPALGMNELPQLMARQLAPDSILFNRYVQSIAADHVVFTDGQKIKAKKVVCAYDPVGATPATGQASHHSVTTYYFTSSKLLQTGWGKWLVLVPKRFGFAVDHFCLISEVAEDYGAGKPLLSASVVSAKDVSETQIVQELNQLAGQELELQKVEICKVPLALPRLSEKPEGYKIIDHVIYCGDRWASPSINGALRSGRLAAESILREQAHPEMARV